MYYLYYSERPGDTVAAKWGILAELRLYARPENVHWLGVIVMRDGE